MKNKAMVQINSSIDEEILKEFRHVIYTRMGLKKGDFKKALEDAMLDYVQKYSTNETTKEAARLAKMRKKASELSR